MWVPMNIPKFVLAVACGLSASATVPACAEELAIIYKVTDRVGGLSAPVYVFDEDAGGSRPVHH